MRKYYFVEIMNKKNKVEIMKEIIEELKKLPVKILEAPYKNFDIIAQNGKENKFEFKKENLSFAEYNAKYAYAFLEGRLLLEFKEIVDAIKK